MKYTLLSLCLGAVTALIPTLLPNGDIVLEYSILDGKPITETLPPEDDVLVIQHQYLGGEAMSVITLSKSK